MRIGYLATVLLVAVVFGFFVWSTGRAYDNYRDRVDARFAQLDNER